MEEDVYNLEELTRLVEARDFRLRLIKETLTVCQELRKEEIITVKEVQ